MGTLESGMYGRLKVPDAEGLTTEVGWVPNGAVAVCYSVMHYGKDDAPQGHEAWARVRFIISGDGKDAMMDFPQEWFEVVGVDEIRVIQLGEKIGYGRVMQLCEQLWSKKVPGGAELTVGPAAALMVPCSHPGHAGEPSKCRWCCGSGRVTKRVLVAIEELEETME